MDRDRQRWIAGATAALAAHALRPGGGAWERGLCVQHARGAPRWVATGVLLLNATLGATAAGSAGLRTQGAGWLVLAASLLVLREDGAEGWALHDWLVRAGSAIVVLGLVMDRHLGTWTAWLAAWLTAWLYCAAFAIFFVAPARRRVFVALVLLTTIAYTVALLDPFRRDSHAPRHAAPGGARAGGTTGRR